MGELFVQKPKLLGLTKIGHDLDKAISNVSLIIFNLQKPCTAPNTYRNEIHLSCNLSDVTSGQNKIAIFKKPHAHKNVSLYKLHLTFFVPVQSV